MTAQKISQAMLRLERRNRRLALPEDNRDCSDEDAGQ